MKKNNLLRLTLEHLRAKFRLRMAEVRHDSAQQSVEMYQKLLTEADERAWASAEDLRVAKGAASLAADKVTWHRVRCGMGLR